MRRYVNLLLTLAVVLISINFINAQPDPPGASHGSNNNATGGGAPIGSGLGTFAVLISLYTLSKIKPTNENKTD